MAEPESDNESAGAAAAAAAAAATGSDPASRTESSLFMSSKEQERFLPIANVSRIMKKALPGNAKVSKEAKEAVQECVSEFISFITGEASDKCLRERRKTINGDDLLWGLATLGFDDYVEPLKSYLARYRETEGDRNITGNNSSSSSSGGGRAQHDLLDLNAASIDLMQVAVGNSSRYPLQQMYWVPQQQQQEN